MNFADAKQKEKLFSRMDECAPSMEHSSETQKTNSQDLEVKEEILNSSSKDEYVDDVITEWALGELMRTKWFQVGNLSAVIR